MKLDKIKFANLIGFIQRQFAINMTDTELRMIDELIDIPEPVAKPIANPQTIEELMKSIHEGKNIEAIKAYRALTGYGLKESKDAVEKYWEFKRSKQELYTKLGEKKLSPDVDNVIANFINSCF